MPERIMDVGKGQTEARGSSQGGVGKAKGAISLRQGSCSVSTNNTDGGDARSRKGAESARDGARFHVGFGRDVLSRYAVPTEIKEMERKQKEQQEDADVIKFKQKYMNPNNVVTEVPVEKEESSDSEDETGQAKDPRKNVGLSSFSYVESLRCI